MVLRLRGPADDVRTGVIAAAGLWSVDRALDDRRTSDLSDICKRRGPQAPRNPVLYLWVANESGVIGRFGPIEKPEALIASHFLLPKLAGRSCIPRPGARQLLEPHRHADSGLWWIAAAAVENALWDLEGRLRRAPAWALVTKTPVRPQIPAYASMLSFDLTDPAALSLAQETADAGFWGQKWLLPFGPSKFPEGMGYRDGFQANLSYVVNLSKHIGPRGELLFECGGQWTPEYLLQFSEALRRSHPSLSITLEEPLATRHQYNHYYRSRSELHCAIALGEHAYTPEEYELLLRQQACRWLQPDFGWTGAQAGRAIVRSCHRSGRPLLPHGAGLALGVHLGASASDEAMPALEYHVGLEPLRRYHWAQRPTPIHGFFPLPSLDGLGIDFHPSCTVKDFSFDEGCR